MKHPLADKFKSGEFTKPVVQKATFYKGGIFAMQKRLASALLDYPGAYLEYTSRTKNLDNSETIGTMWDYIKLE